MFWSRVDCRTSKEQSFMSLVFVHTETVKHSLINTHIPYAHFILVLFIATPLSLTFCKKKKKTQLLLYTLPLCRFESKGNMRWQNSEMEMLRFSRRWKWVSSHLFLNKAFPSGARRWYIKKNYKDTRYLELHKNGFWSISSLLPNILLIDVTLLCWFRSYCTEKKECWE